MTTIKKNILANYLGAGWNALMSLAFVPLYIKYLGIEAYGLIGFFASLQAVLHLLDMGLGTTLSREVARLSVETGSGQRMRDTVKTFATVYWGIALTAGVAFAAGAPFYAKHWLRSNSLEPSTIMFAAVLMAVGIAVRWPGAMYAGTLSGLQKQVTMNAVQSAAMTARGIGAILILKYVSPTIVAFFAWQACVNLATTGAFRFFANAGMPRAGRAHFSFAILYHQRTFAAGMTLVSLLALLLTQTDKLLLSKLVPLKDYGYYVLACTVSGVLFMALGPITGAVYPRFSQLVKQRDEKVLASMFHRAAQSVSLMIIPAALILAFFPLQVLYLWTRDHNIATHAAPLLRLVSLGTMFNGFMHVPYQLQLSHKWTALINSVNAFAVASLVPLLLYTVPRFGAIGGAFAWLVLNGGYVVFMPLFMHRRILPGEMGRWYVNDIGLPLLTTASCAWLLSRLPIGTGAWMECMVMIAAVAVLIFLATLAALPAIRRSAIAVAKHTGTSILRIAFSRLRGSALCHDKGDL